jgi:hypothetical protein
MSKRTCMMIGGQMREGRRDTIHEEEDSEDFIKTIDDDNILCFFCLICFLCLIS